MKELEKHLDEMEKRMDARFDRMENMLTQLIGIVGEINKRPTTWTNDSTDWKKM